LTRKRVLILAAFVCGLALAAGCTGGRTPEDRQRLTYMGAVDSYVSAVDALVLMRQTGRIDDAGWAAVQESDNAAYAALVAWRASLLDGASVEASLAIFRSALADLLRRRAAAEGAVTGG
jgi:hypothetical protein